MSIRNWLIVKLGGEVKKPMTYKEAQRVQNLGFKAMADAVALRSQAQINAGLGYKGYGPYSPTHSKPDES